MFESELLEKILLDEEISKIPCGIQADMINAIERIIDNNNYEIVKKE